MNPTFLPYNSAENQMPVLLEGNIIGNIRAHVWGWWYVPLGQKSGRHTFHDIASVKASLTV